MQGLYSLHHMRLCIHEGNSMRVYLYIAAVICMRDPECEATLEKSDRKSSGPVYCQYLK